MATTLVTLLDWNPSTITKELPLKICNVNTSNFVNNLYINRQYIYIGISKKGNEAKKGDGDK